jgi:hypothetical protein
LRDVVPVSCRFIFPTSSGVLQLRVAARLERFIHATRALSMSVTRRALALFVSWRRTTSGIPARFVAICGDRGIALSRALDTIASSSARVRCHMRVSSLQLRGAFCR